MNDIKRKLDELSQYWKNMDRSNETQRKAAEEYYKKELMPILIQYFLQVNNHEEECEALVLTLGQSYEPLVFSILTLKPKKVFILCTDESLHLLDDVIEFTKLKPSQYVSSKVASESPLELYQEIKKIYEQWGRPKNIYVDFTGGTKSMSAGCAMAGVAIKAKLVYIR